MLYSSKIRGNFEIVILYADVNVDKNVIHSMKLKNNILP